MSIVITLVGGPADGRDIPIPDTMPPFSYRVAVPAPPSALFGFASPDHLLDPPSPAYTVAEYRPLLVEYMPSLTDDGRYRYEYVGDDMPLHPAQRRPSYTVDELAEAGRGPLPRSAYPSHREWLLAHRIRDSLHRDARLNDEERAAVNEVTVWHVRVEVRRRRAS